MLAHCQAFTVGCSQCSVVRVCSCVQDDDDYEGEDEDGDEFVEEEEDEEGTPLFRPSIVLIHPWGAINGAGGCERRGNFISKIAFWF